ncbi:MAG TPA: hypothetical protein VMR92_02555, partial [Gemmatimonadales bacterium]|nr:hypothetical protein [Gemmatimonadales bacterium]
MSETEFERQLGAAIREELPALRAPAELRDRVRAAIRDTAAPVARPRFSPPTRWLALAASVVLV